jgi:hypothetical protein
MTGQFLINHSDRLLSFEIDSERYVVGAGETLWMSDAHGCLAVRRGIPLRAHTNSDTTNLTPETRESIDAVLELAELDRQAIAAASKPNVKRKRAKQ